MKVLITGAAGNLGLFLTRHWLNGHHQLRLLTHRAMMPFDVAPFANVSLHRADLGDRATLSQPCKEIDCIVHFAGALFAPNPEKFLPTTNVIYVRNLVEAARAAGVRKFILVSFPHVEGESFPDRPASGRLDGNPSSVHAQTRLAAEKLLFESCRQSKMTPVVLRPGMIYARGVLMIDAARWLLSHRLLAVWNQPTWIHLLALPDFLACVNSAVENSQVNGIYPLGDDHPLTLQEFLERVAAHWGQPRPWRLPSWCIFAAAGGCEAFATLFRTASPLTKDFIRIGMASYVCDTSRMREELLPNLSYPSLREGLELL